MVFAGGALGIGGADSRTKGAEAMGQSDATFKTNVNAGALARASIGAQKAWISPEREAQSKQLELSAQIAQTQWQQAQQTLIMRTAQRYFDVVGAKPSQYCNASKKPCSKLRLKSVSVNPWAMPA
jgi:outer membrane protein